MSFVSPGLAVGSDVEFVGPAVARLLVELPIDLGDRRRVYQAIGFEPFGRFVPRPRVDALAPPRRLAVAPVKKIEPLPCGTMRRAASRPVRKPA